MIIKNKKGISNVVIFWLIVIVIGVIFVFTQYQIKTQQLAIQNEPDRFKQCISGSDSLCTKDTCENTYGQWQGCTNIGNGDCPACKCPERSIGWVKSFGCYYRISAKQ